MPAANTRRKLVAMPKPVGPKPKLGEITRETRPGGRVTKQMSVECPDCGSVMWVTLDQGVEAMIYCDTPGCSRQVNPIVVS